MVFFSVFGYVTKNDDSPYTHTHSHSHCCGHKYSKNFKHFGACHIASIHFFLVVDLLTFFYLFRFCELLFPTVPLLNIFSFVVFVSSLYFIVVVKIFVVFLFFFCPSGLKIKRSQRLKTIWNISCADLIHKYTFEYIFKPVETTK